MSIFSTFPAEYEFVLAGVVSTISAAVSALIYFILREKENTRFHSRFSSMRLHYERTIYELESKLLKTSKNWTDTYQLYLTEAQKSVGRALFSYVPDLKNHRFFGTMGIMQNIEIDKNLAFVLMPFHDDFYGIYFSIQRSCHALGLRCLRGDEEHITGDLLPNIVKSILTANVIICVLDGRNPNVMYELGLAHAFDKYVILVASGIEEANSVADIKSNRVVVFKDLVNLTEELHIALARVFRSQSNPI